MVLYGLQILENLILRYFGKMISYDFICIFLTMKGYKKSIISKTCFFFTFSTYLLMLENHCI